MSAITKIQLYDYVNKIWIPIQFSDVRTVAKAFISLGLESRKSVGILGFNSPEWFIADMAAVFANGITTGIYATNSPEMCKYMANHRDVLTLRIWNPLYGLWTVKNRYFGANWGLERGMDLLKSLKTVWCPKKFFRSAAQCSSWVIWNLELKKLN